MLSVFGLALNPFLSAFLLVELAAVPVLVGVLTGGVLTLHLLTVVVERHGLGNGYAVVLLGLAVPPALELVGSLLELVRTEVLTVGVLLVLLLGVLGLIRGLVRLMRGGVPGPVPGVGPPLSFHLPTCGLAAVTLASAVLVLPRSLADARTPAHPGPSGPQPGGGQVWIPWRWVKDGGKRATHAMRRSAREEATAFQDE